MVFSPLKLDLRPVTQHETQNGVEISLKLPMVLKKKCRAKTLKDAIAQIFCFQAKPNRKSSKPWLTAKGLSK